MTVYMAIHCHFYQPPRENPWTEEIECQDSAEPFHDWNERIDHECFTPNAWARIVNTKGSVSDIVNNYRYISFNVGPTLMSWLEEKSPATYHRILDADRQSVIERSGHGNAIAQVYNHMILPLANEQDKITQIKWGLADFSYRFNRQAESIWLAETAVDYKTLEILIDHNIKYLILSPHQAAKCKPLNKNLHWTDVNGGNIDPSRAYRCFVGSRYIDIFFYDGPISRAIGFEDLLHDAKKFINRFSQAVVPSRHHAQIIHAATDGETYGHHKRFGEMALAYAVTKEAKQRNFIVTNYGEYLEKYPPEWEVVIKDVSSWSCAHGVRRWNDNCGCKTGGDPNWHQLWRKPFREALDYVRNQLITIYEQKASAYFVDVWQARNNYISVILDRSSENIDLFFKHNAQHELSSEEKTNAILLLEMQRFAMLMYTSCAWFFSEVSGIETVQVMRYAARAIQLATKFIEDKKDRIELRFIELLKHAPSNSKEYDTAADVYRKEVKPAVVNLERIAYYYGTLSIFEKLHKKTRIFCYDIERVDYKKQQLGDLSLAVGRVHLKSMVTTEQSDLIFGILHTGGKDLFCAASDFPGNEKYKHIKQILFKDLPEKSLMEIIRELDEQFGPHSFTFKDLFIEKRREILRIVSDQLLGRFAQTYNRIYEENLRVIMALKADGLPVPDEYKIAAEYVLSFKLNQALDQITNFSDAASYTDIFQIVEEAKENNYRLNKRYATEQLSSVLKEMLVLIAHSNERSIHEKTLNDVVEFLLIADAITIKLDLKPAQDIYFDFLQKHLSGHRQHAWHSAALRLAEILRIDTENLKK